MTGITSLPNAPRMPYRAANAASCKAKPGAPAFRLRFPPVTQQFETLKDRSIVGTILPQHVILLNLQTIYVQSTKLRRFMQKCVEVGPGASGPMDCCVRALPLGAAAMHVFAYACSAKTRLPSVAVIAPAQTTEWSDAVLRADG